MSNITTNTNTIKLNTFQTEHVPDQNQNKSVSKTLQSTNDREQEKAAENWVNMQISKNNLDGQSTLFDITKGLIDIPKHLSLKFIFKSLLKCKVNVNAVDSKTEKTPLMTAIEMSDDRHDKFHIILLLLYHGANVNRCPNTFKSPLDLAVDLGNLDIVRILLNRGANTCEKNEFASTLHKAIRDNNVEMAQLLIQNGATLIELDAFTLFKRAIIENNVEMAQCLVQKNVTLMPVLVSKLINLAVSKNSVQMVQLLVQNGVTLTTEGASTLLRKAIKYNNVQMAQFFLQNGAKLKTLAVSKNSVQRCQCLVQNDATLTDEDGSESLDIAIKNNNAQMAQLLVQNGATLTMKDVSARLDEAIKNENVPMAQVLKVIKLANTIVNTPDNFNIQQTNDYDNNAVIKATLRLMERNHVLGCLPETKKFPLKTSPTLWNFNVIKVPTLLSLKDIGTLAQVNREFREIFEINVQKLINANKNALAKHT